MQLKQSPNRKEEQNRLIAYLDDFGKQISNRKNSNGLEEQLSSLSRAYNQAQQKLLQTERALMNESILLQKQRSIIDIYKHIVGENMEDDGILNFIQDLEEDQEKRDIFQELQCIKMLLDKKKRKKYKQSFEGDRTVKELRKELRRMEGQRECLSDESSFMISQNQELKSKLEGICIELEHYKAESDRLKIQSQRMSVMIQVQQKDLQRQKQQNRQKNRRLDEQRRKQTQLQSMKEQFQTIAELISSKLCLSDDKENLTSNYPSKGDKMSSKKYLNQLQSKINHLLKYKSQYKKLKQSSLNNQFFKQEVLLLKMFLSEQALQLFKEYQQQRLECIESQLRNLSVLERHKMLRLQECQREIWKYRLLVMRQDQSNGFLETGQLRMTHSLQPNILSSRIAGTLIESMPVGKLQLQAGRETHNISQFMPDL